MELVAVVVEGLLTFVVVIHALVVVILLLLGLEEARDDMVSGYRVNRMGQHSWQVVKGGRPWRDWSFITRTYINVILMLDANLLTLLRLKQRTTICQLFQALTYVPSFTCHVLQRNRATAQKYWKVSRQIIFLHKFSSFSESSYTVYLGLLYAIRCSRFDVHLQNLANLNLWKSITFGAYCMLGFWRVFVPPVTPGSPAGMLTDGWPTQTGRWPVSESLPFSAHPRERRKSGGRVVRLYNGTL